MNSIDYPLSDSDIKSLTSPHLKCLEYNSIKDYSSIESLLGKQKACVILFPTFIDEGRKSGHWIILLKSKTPKTIEFFDSYGMTTPEQQIKFAKNELNSYYLNKHLLKELCQKDGYAIEFSKRRIQSWDPKVATCGRWCALRYQYKDLTPLEFIRMMRKEKFRTKKSYDELVLEATPL